MSIIISAFSAGLLSFFSPCIFPLLPVYIGYFSSDEVTTLSPKKQIVVKIVKTLLFIAGISVVFVLLGFGAGALGSVLSGPTFTVCCGLVVFIFGLHHAGVINIPFLEKQKSIDLSIRSDGYLTVFLLGLVFSFGWTPCIGPVLASVLSLTADNGSALMGGWLLFIYSLGLSIPFLILSIGASVLLNKIKKLNRYLPLIKLIGGLLIALMGLWMIFSQVTSLEQGVSNNYVAEVSQGVISEGEDFSLNSVNGTTISLSDYRGKPVCVKFWGTWCPSCMAEIESFENLANEINSENQAAVISVAAPDFHGEMSRDDFISWANSQGLTFPILLDEGAQVNRKYNLEAYPTYLFFDKNGNLDQTVPGAISDEKIKSIIEELE